MANARSFDEKRARLRSLASAPEHVARAELKKLLGDKNGYLVGECGDVAKELGLRDLVPDLVAAFPRFVEGGAKTDPGCFGKNHLVEALLHFDAHEPDTYLAGLRCRQHEGAIPFRVDTAAGLRGLCAHALFHIGHRSALLNVAPLLFDSEAITRVEAATALGDSGLDGAAAALHVKLLSGDPEPDVLGAIYKGLLRILPERYLRVVEEALTSEEDGPAEAAALALGESRARGAFEVLKRAANAPPIGRRGPESVLLGLALLRSDEATAFLLDRVENGSEPRAVQAISALALHRHDESITARIRDIVRRRGSERLEEAVREKLDR